MVKYGVRAKQAVVEVCRASKGSGGAGGTAGRPRIVDEGDVLRVYTYISGPLILYCCLKLMHCQTSELRRLRIGM